MVEKDDYDPTAAAAEILKELAPYSARNFTLDAAAAALLVIDMQNAFIHPRGSIYLPAGAAVVDNIAAVAAAFRRAGRPVFFTRHAEDPSGANAGLMREWWGATSPQEGTWESQLYDGLAPRPGDAIIPKIRYNAFIATDLDQRLRQARVTDIVIAGVMTNLCCESTARDAFMRDFRVFFLADGTAAPTLAMHRASLLNLAYGFAVVTTAAEIIAALGPKK